MKIFLTPSVTLICLFYFCLLTQCHKSRNRSRPLPLVAWRHLWTALKWLNKEYLYLCFSYISWPIVSYYLCLETTLCLRFVSFVKYFVCESVTKNIYLYYLLKNSSKFLRTITKDNIFFRLFCLKRGKEGGFFSRRNALFTRVQISAENTS